MSTLIFTENGLWNILDQQLFLSHISENFRSLKYVHTYAKKYWLNHFPAMQYINIRFFDCLAHPNLRATLATDQKWPLTGAFFETGAYGVPSKSQKSFICGGHTVVLWLICRHRLSYQGNSTYMKVILTKNLTFIIIIYHIKFQFAKISGTIKKM